MEAHNKILVIDDEPDIGTLIADTAEELGLECIATTDAAHLPDLLEPDVTLILLDLMMPEMDGVETLRLLSELRCRAGVVLMSGMDQRVLETAEKLARTLGLFIVGHLTKPFQQVELEELLKTTHVKEAGARVLSLPRVLVKTENLRLAIERNEFVLHYQPQIEISTGAVVGVEALVRWQNPERGLIFPNSFIGRAEELGLIDDLGWLVAHRAFAEFDYFMNRGNSVPRLAINCSPYSLRDLKFPDKLSALLKQYNVPAERLIVEITESGLLNEPSNTLDVLTRLRVKGVHLSIDDFGTGYAMLQHLVNIPASELKIDRSFIMNMDRNSSDKLMVSKSIEIGHELGMKVVGEGVETAQQLDFLRRAGCDVAQGHVFAHALPPMELVHWLNEYNSRRAG